MKNKVASRSWEMSKYRQIGFLAEAGVDIDLNEYQNDENKIVTLLHEGVDYKDKKMRYWVDGQGQDCFAIYARGLDITNSDRPVYWQWKADSNGIEVAEVVKTRWLEVRGSFWTLNLSPNVWYKVSFQMAMATPSSDMEGEMVNLRLTLPDGTNQEKQGKLPGVPLPGNDPWHELEAGRFYMTAQNVGKMEFSMEKLLGRWGTGLVIKCVEIKAEIEAKVEAEFEAENEAECEAEVKAEVMAENEAEVKAEKEAEVKAEKEAEVKAKNEAEVEAKNEEENEAEVKAE